MNDGDDVKLVNVMCIFNIRLYCNWNRGRESYFYGVVWKSSICLWIFYVCWSGVRVKGGCFDEKWYGDDYSYLCFILCRCSSCVFKYVFFKRRVILVNGWCWSCLFSNGLRFWC